MSVVGIDFGNSSCCIAVARAGGIETITNDYSQRQTPSCVAFGSKRRVLGVAAKNQQVTNMQNTVVNFKRLLGRQYRDAHVSRVLGDMANRVIETEDGGVGVSVRYLDQENVFSPEQITSMLFTKLKETAEVALQSKMHDVVISVPLFFTDVERRAVLHAAQIAGLNVLRLLNDTTASALAYGIYKTDLPEADQNPRNVVFIDCGQSAMQASVCAFNKGKLKVLATSYDATLGGAEFDKLLADHFTADFKQRYNVDASTSARVRLRLLTECEKLKKQMSANSTRLPINIECFMNDKDVSGYMERATFEQMSTSLLEAVEAMLRRCLSSCSLSQQDIHAVELVGGASRVPAVRRLVEQVFGVAPSTTLNQDEAVARGCALQCAMLSPTFRVREFNITDQQPYTVRLIWPTGDMDVFPKGHAVPYSKMLTFYQTEDLSLTSKYSGDVPYPDPFIGTFTVGGVTSAADGNQQRVKVKVRINKHGIFTLASATLVQQQPGADGSDDKASISTGPTVDAADDSQPMADGEAGDSPSDTSAPSTVPAPDEAAANGDQAEVSAEQNSTPAADNKQTPASQDDKKVKVVKTELPVDAILPGLRFDTLNNLIEKEAQMISNDKLENDRQDAKNSVEEYVYDLRGRLCEELSEFVPAGDKDRVQSLLEETEEWLYGDGEDCQKSVYIERISQLKSIGEPIRVRHREFSERPDVFNAMITVLNRADKIVQAFRGGDAAYDHLDAAEVEKVEKGLNEKRQWMDQQMALLSNLPREMDPPITIQQLHNERQAFESMANPILNKVKPKPKVEQPPTNNGTPAPTAPTGKDSTTAPSGGEKTNHSEETMDVD